MEFGMHWASTQHQFTLLKRRAGRGKNLPAHNEHDVTWKNRQFLTFLMAKNEVLFGDYENFAEEL